MTQNIMGASSALPQVLVSQQLAAAQTTQYTCPANSAVKISNAVISNSSGSAVTVSLSLCKSGQTADGTHQVISGYSLAAGDSSVVTELQNQFLGAGDFVSAIAGTGAAVTFAMSGVVFS